MKNLEWQHAIESGDADGLIGMDIFPETWTEQEIADAQKVPQAEQGEQ